MLKHITAVIALFSMYQWMHGQSQKPSPFSFEASYTGDTYMNAAGGLKTGAGYMGMGNLKMNFDTEKVHWWKGGNFFIHGVSIHGKSLSEHFAGDLQIVSNIDAGTHVYMHELWFSQAFEKISLTVGLQDLNADFLASENGGEFINSSFGVPPVLSCNLPVPIFPLTGLGISFQWNINDRFTWQSALFDGCQSPFEKNNPYNLHWRFSKDDGMLAITEFHSRFNLKGMDGIYKLGAYHHSGLRELDEETQFANTVFSHNYGFYLIADQSVFEQGSRKINLFTQIAAAPKSKNKHAYYLGLGANCYGIFNKEGKDLLGFAVASLDLQRLHHSHETALELYYRYQLYSHIAIQPDIQYIVNPSGTDTILKNSFICLLRLHVNF